MNTAAMKNPYPRRHPRRLAAAVWALAGCALVGVGLAPPAPAAPTGGLHTWGENGSGQLGQGVGPDTGSHPTPAPVVNLDNVTQTAAGAVHSLALKQDKTVWAWGSDGRGELGDGPASTANRTTPVQVKQLPGLLPLDNVVATAAGCEHSLAVKADGSVWAWGSNNQGQLGNGDDLFNSQDAAVQVRSADPGLGFLANIASVAGGCEHSLAVDRSGAAWAWGYDQYGQLGDGDASGNRLVGTSNLPVRVTGLQSGVVQVAGGGRHSLARKSDGTVYSFGYNAHGELGQGTADTNIHALATKVKDGTGTSAPDLVAQDIAAGYFHSVAVRTDGLVRAWGGNFEGQVGLDPATVFQQTTPVAVANLSGVDTVSANAGGSHSLALLDTSGQVRSWGYNSNGQLGNYNVTADDSYTVVTVVDANNQAVTGVFEVDAGGIHSMARF